MALKNHSFQEVFKHSKSCMQSIEYPYISLQTFYFLGQGYSVYQILKRVSVYQKWKERGTRELQSPNLGKGRSSKVKCFEFLLLRIKHQGKSLRSSRALCIGPAPSHPMGPNGPELHPVLSVFNSVLTFNAGEKGSWLPNIVSGVNCSSSFF